MAILWGTFKTYITEGVLKDPTGAKYTADQLLLWCRWALVEMSYHTAEMSYVDYVGNGKDYQFPIPDNVCDNIEKTGLVGWSNGDTTTYLVPLRLEPNTTWTDLVNVTPQPLTGSALARSDSLSDRAFSSTAYTPGYWEWPTQVMTLSFIPGENDVLRLHYFKYWDFPVDDNSLLHIPIWMEKPCAYLIGAGAMDPKGVSASDIRQWNDKQQSGTPEHNPLHKQAEFFIKHAERLMAKQQPQDRQTFYKANLFK